jgi:hypothetical protein
MSRITETPTNDPTIIPAATISVLRGSLRVMDGATGAATAFAGGGGAVALISCVG